MTMDAAMPLDPVVPMDSAVPPTPTDAGLLVVTDAGAATPDAAVDVPTLADTYMLLFSATIPSVDGEGRDWDLLDDADPYVSLITSNSGHATADATEDLDNVVGEVMWEGIVFPREALDGARMTINMYDFDELSENTPMCRASATFAAEWFDEEPHLLNCEPVAGVPESRTIVLRVTAVPVF